MKIGDYQIEEMRIVKKLKNRIKYMKYCKERKYIYCLTADGHIEIVKIGR